MKKYLVATLILIVLGVSLAAVAQQAGQQNARGERMRQRWAAQQQAIEKIQKLSADLKADMEEAALARQNQPPRENMTDEERAKLRETWAKRREKQQGIVTEMEHQVAILKGSGQLQTELEADLNELKAIRDLATEEKAEKTATRLIQFIDIKQTNFDTTLKNLGLERVPGEGRDRGEAGRTRERDGGGSRQRNN